MHAVVTYVHAGSRLYTGFNLACIVGLKYDEDQKYYILKDPAYMEMIGLVESKVAPGVVGLNSVDDGSDLRSSQSRIRLKKDRRLMFLQSNGSGYTEETAGLMIIII